MKNDINVNEKIEELENKLDKFIKENKKLLYSQKTNEEINKLEEDREELITLKKEIMDFFIDFLKKDYIQALEILELAGEIAKIHNEKLKKMIEDREERERKMREMEAELRMESKVWILKNGKWVAE